MLASQDCGLLGEESTLSWIDVVEEIRNLTPSVDSFHLAHLSECFPRDMLPVADYDSIVKGDTSLLSDDFVDEDWKDSDSRRRHLDILERWVFDGAEGTEEEAERRQEMQDVRENWHNPRQMPLVQHDNVLAVLRVAGHLI